jgi:hypothetical protein
MRMRIETEIINRGDVLRITSHRVKKKREGECGCGPVPFAQFSTGAYGLIGFHG